MNEMKLTVPQEDAGKRIDSWLSEHIDGLTRSAVQNLLSEQAVNADGKAVKKNYKLAGGEVLTVIMPELREVDLAAEDIPLDIVYEDEDIVVVNKPRSMVVHPAVGNWSGTLVNALMFQAFPALTANIVPALFIVLTKTPADCLSLPKTIALIRVLRHRLRHILRIAAMKRS